MPQLTTAHDDVLLAVHNLKTYFYTHEGVVPVVDGVSFTIRRGQSLCLVGESGCGKTVTALSVMKLVPPPGRIVDGSIVFDGQDLAPLDDRAMNAIRGKRIAMIFQEPMTSLNPVLTVGVQIMEAVQAHERVSAHEARDRAIELLGLVGIPQPSLRFRAYPHELSGGTRQRVMIAMALAGKPDLIIADEPTSALDVTIQAQILDLLRELKERTGMAMLLITHDLGVVAEMADEVVVMYAGKIVERSDVVTLFREPRHPYTQALLASVATLTTPRDERLKVISGSVPHLLRRPPGCRFAPRCADVMPICRTAEPVLIRHDRTDVACWKYEQRASAEAPAPVRGA